jgi:signal transduction histidine kinase
MTPFPRTAARLDQLLVHSRQALARLVGWSRQHPLLADSVLAALVAALSVPPISALTGPDHALSLGLIITLACPLIWRRRAPFAVFAVLTGLALGQFLFSRGVIGDEALLVAFYTIAAYQPFRRVLAAAAILAAGITLAVTAAGHPLGTWLLLAGLAAVTGFLGYYARTRRAYLAALLERAERLERERGQQQQLAAAAERARIAREMHDIVAHNIAVMIALADGAAYTAPASPSAPLMHQVSATGRAALGEMRRLLGVLREPAEPDYVPQPTLDDVADLLATVRAAGLPARMTVTGQPFPLPPSAHVALYRMIQEALTNTLKHAPGATADVRLAYRPGEVALEVSDDGGPAAAAGAPARRAGGGHGIEGMRERAAVFGGQVSAGPRPGGGWRVHTVLRSGAAPVGGAGAVAVAEGA